MTIFQKIVLLALLFAAPAAAQNAVVTGTFRPPSGQTPQAAGLRSFTVAATAMCGTLTFTPYTAAGSSAQQILLTYGGVDYFPQPVLAYIRCSDGALMGYDRVADTVSVGTRLIPNINSTPSGTVWRVAGKLNGSPNGAIKDTNWTEDKVIPDSATADWPALAKLTSPGAITYTGVSGVQDEGTPVSFYPTLNFTGAGVTATADAGNNRINVNITSGGGYVTVANEGSNLTQRQIINFIGAGVDCVDNSGASRTDCTISGGGGGSLTVREVDGAPSVSSVTTLEFLQSAGFVVTDQTGGVARVALAAVPDSVLATISTAGKVADSALSSSVSLLGQTIESAEVTDGTLTAGDLGTDSVSADELNATGVEAELEAVLDLSDLQGDLALSQITQGTGVLEASGGDPAYTQDLATVRRFRQVFYFADAYADLQAASDAVNTAGGGIVLLSDDTDYALPTTGLVLKDGVMVMAADGRTATLTCNGVTGGVHCVSTAASANVGLRNVVIVKGTGNYTGATLRTGAGAGLVYENIFINSTGGAAPVGFQVFAAANSAVIRNIRVQNGAGTTACDVTSAGSAPDFNIRVENLSCGTPGARSLVITNSANITFVNAHIDEQDAAAATSVDVVNSTGIRFQGGEIFCQSSGSAPAVRIDSTSHNFVMEGTKVRPYNTNTCGTLITQAADGGRFINMRMNEGTVTDAISFASGADNNLVTGHVTGTITDSGANNRQWVFNGTNWTGNLSDAEIANTITAGQLAANGANCSAGQAPLGVDTVGAVEGCFAVQASDQDLTDIAGLTRNRGDLMIGGASNWTDLAIGASGRYLRSDGTDPSWATIAAADLGSGFVDAASDLAAGLCSDGQILKKVTGVWACASDDTGAGGGYATIQEEGSGLTQRNTLNFVGGGFTAADDAGNTRTNVTLDADLNTIAGLTYTRGDLIVGGASNWTDLAIGVANRYLSSDGTDVSWAQVSLSSGVTGTLDQANLDANVVMDNEANTWSTGDQSFAAASSLLVPTSAGYAPTADGSFGYDSTQDAFVAGGAGGVKGFFPRVLFMSNCTTTSTCTGTDQVDAASGAQGTTETNFATNWSMPASFLTANKAVEVCAIFRYSSSAGQPNFTIRLKAGSTVLAAHAAQAGSASALMLTPRCFQIQGTAAPGASVNVQTGPVGYYGRMATNELITTDQPIALATNGALTIQFSNQWGAATTGNTMQMLQMWVVEKY